MSDNDSSFILGVDVGSTTAKVVLIENGSREILWKDYQRHETLQAEKTLELISEVESKFHFINTENTRVFVTGSGAKTLVEPLGAGFVQEVVAVTLAVEQQFDDVGSVVELGGQDAKIIIFKINPKTGEKQPIKQPEVCKLLV